MNAENIPGAFICHRVFAGFRTSRRVPVAMQGFTLIEVMISLAIIGALLVTLLYTLSYHLGVAERQMITTIAMNLAKEKLYEMNQSPAVSKGSFNNPYTDYFYATKIAESSFPGMIEIVVVVKNRAETVTLSELIQRQK